MGTNSWTSLDDLFNAILTSSFIPCFTESEFYTTFRGKCAGPVVGIGASAWAGHGWGTGARARRSC